MEHDDNLAIRIFGVTEKEETYISVIDIGPGT